MNIFIIFLNKSMFQTLAGLFCFLHTTYSYLWAVAEKRGLWTYASSKDPTACASAQSGQDICCSPTQHRERLEGRGLIAKI